MDVDNEIIFKKWKIEECKDIGKENCVRDIADCELENLTHH